MLPNFLVIGAPKAGTTTLCHDLSSHSQVFITDPKEPHYFGRDDPEKTMEWYQGLFSAVDREIAIGDGSTSYTHPMIIEKAAESIFELLPDCRLIYIVRNPIKRLESDWKMRLHEGWTPKSINEAVRTQDRLVTHGLYWKNISVYRNLFPDEQILVSFLEDYSRSPETELERCLSHLGVKPEPTPTPDSPEALNRSADMRKDGLLASFLRDNDIVDGLRRYLPTWAFQMGKSLTTRKEVYSLEWDDQLKQAVVERFSPDSRQFLEFYGKPPDFWDL